MPRQRYYTPQLRRDLVGRLYHAAKARSVPMTVLSNQMVEEGLNQLGQQSETSRVREETSSQRADG